MPGVIGIRTSRKGILEAISMVHYNWNVARVLVKQGCGPNFISTSN